MKGILAALAMLSAAACDSSDAVPAQARPPTVDIARAPELQLTGRVVDAARVIDDQEEQALTVQLAKLEKATTDQMVVVTVPGLNGQSIEHFSLELANRWKIGRADVDNGVMILVAPTERKVRVEVGLGLEGLLTDAKAGEVVKAMLPRFTASDHAVGVRIAVDQIDRLLRSDMRRPQPKPTMRKAA